jgi:hypothetical protein
MELEVRVTHGSSRLCLWVGVCPHLPFVYLWEAVCLVSPLSPVWPWPGHFHLSVCSAMTWGHSRPYSLKESLGRPGTG